MLAIHFRQTPSPACDFRWACYGAYLMLLTMGLGPAFSALASARTHHHEATTILLVIFGYTFVVWLIILVGIQASWPEGWIHKRRRRRKEDHGGLGPGPIPYLRTGSGAGASSF